MPNFNSLRQKPFHLSDNQIEWVESTLKGLSQKDKIGQLFCLCAVEGTENEIDRTNAICKPGGMMYRQFTTEQAVNLTNLYRKKSEIPMLIAANLERGGNGIVTEGTSLGSPTAVAATDDVKFATYLGNLCGAEGAAVGANWAFAPIIDIDYNWRNPITNTRTFGSDPERVKNFGKAYVEAVQKNGVAASIKHFPGDGCDERDQHLVTTINDLSCEDWDKTYGAIYQESIDAGALTVMIGHIMQPAWEKKLNPALKDEELMPASLSSALMNGLLREKLGFNGLIVTDATSMAGFTIPMSRSETVPFCIAAGADMFLFARNLEEDFMYMCKGVEDGVITQERLDESVMRILGLKAALKLNESQPELDLETVRASIGTAEHKKWAKECADMSVTIVKEEVGVLPLTPKKYRKVLFCPIESDASFFSSFTTGICNKFGQMLKDGGFDVDFFEPSKGMEGSAKKFSDVQDKYDIIIYLANMATKSNQTTVRIEWEPPMCSNGPHYIPSVPTVFISVENPYHLIDVPRVKTYINTFSSTDESLQSLLDKLMGKSEFKGTNPNDPFCGKWDTRLS